MSVIIGISVASASAAASKSALKAEAAVREAVCEIRRAIPGVKGTKGGEAGYFDGFPQKEEDVSVTIRVSERRWNVTVELANGKIDTTYLRSQQCSTRRLSRRSRPSHSRKSQQR